MAESQISKKIPVPADKLQEYQATIFKKNTYITIAILSLVGLLATFMGSTVGTVKIIPNNMAAAFALKVSLLGASVASIVIAYKQYNQRKPYTHRKTIIKTFKKNFPMLMCTRGIRMNNDKELLNLILGTYVIFSNDVKKLCTNTSQLETVTTSHQHIKNGYAYHINEEPNSLIKQLQKNYTVQAHEQNIPRDGRKQNNIANKPDLNRTLSEGNDLEKAFAIAQLIVKTKKYLTPCIMEKIGDNIVREKQQQILDSQVQQQNFKTSNQQLQSDSNEMPKWISQDHAPTITGILECLSEVNVQLVAPPSTKGISE